MNMSKTLENGKNNFFYENLDKEYYLNNFKIDISGTIIDMAYLDNICIEDFCSNCRYNTTFVCNRNNIPLEKMKEFLKNKKIIVIFFSSREELYDNLYKWNDCMHRKGDWLTIQCGNYHCDVCGDMSCDKKMCKNSTINTESKKKKQPKGGNKKIIFCIKYFGINVDMVFPMKNYSKRTNIGYLLINNKIK